MSVPAPSLRASESVHYCLGEFNALLKCDIICKDSELANIRAGGIIFFAFSSCKSFDLHLPGESDPWSVTFKSFRDRKQYFFGLYFERSGTAQYWKVYELENFSHKPSQDTSSLVSAG